MIKQCEKKILVVDDDPDILEALQFTLEDAGYEVKTTDKGELRKTCTIPMGVSQT